MSHDHDCTATYYGIAVGPLVVPYIVKQTLDTIEAVLARAHLMRLVAAVLVIRLIAENTLPDRIEKPQLLSARSTE